MAGSTVLPSPASSCWRRRDVPGDEHQHPGGMDSRGGNLGSGVLKRFNLAIDYANSRILLTPNKGNRAPFEWDMSGLRLYPHAGGMRVEAVLQDSPAAKAGVTVDDMVTHVNGRPVTRKDFENVRQLMRRDGSTIELTTERDGKTRKVKLQLRRMV